MDVAGPSLPVCSRVATMILWFSSISLSLSNSENLGVVPHWRRGCLTPGLLLLTGMRPENPGRAPKSGCGVRRCVRVRRRSLGASCLGCLPRLPVRLRLHVPVPRSVNSWTFLRRAHLALVGCSTTSPTPEYSTTAFQVHRAASNPLSFVSSLSDVGGCIFALPLVSLSVCLLPRRPSPNENPAFPWRRWVPSGLPAP